MRNAMRLFGAVALLASSAAASAGVVIADCGGTFGTSTTIAHTQTSTALEEVFRCPHDPGHDAITRTYEITNSSSRGWLSYLFDVRVEPPITNPFFGWDKTHAAALTNALKIEFLSLTQARVTFDSVLGIGEKFSASLRFLSYPSGTAIVDGTPTIPEPATLSLVAAGLFAAGVRRRNRR